MDKKLFTFSGQSLSRQVSLRTVFRTVIEEGAISRAELARRTGLSKQTVSEVVRELVEEGWLREIGQTRGNIGRSATNYELNSRRAYVLAGDLGGTKLALAVADLAGNIVAETSHPTDSRGGQHVIDQIGVSAMSLVREAGIPEGTVLCCAMGVPGAYDAQSDRLRLVSNITDLEDCRMALTLGTMLGMPVLIENDVTIAAKGELWQGKGQDLDSFAFMAMGTGIGLGIVSGKTVVRGARGGAGEIASLPIGGDPFDSRTFRSGTLESTVSSAAILQRYRDYGGLRAASVAEIFDRLSEGEEPAVAVINEVARTVALAIVAIRAVIDPEIVITGGSIGSRPELVERIRAILPSCTPEPVPLEISLLGGRAALIGAISTALDHARATIV